MNLSNPTRRRTFLQSAFAAATAAFIGNKTEAVLTASVNSSGIGPTNARSLSKTAEGSPRPKNL
jgi:hypothetical protein